MHFLKSGHHLQLNMEKEKTKKITKRRNTKKCADFSAHFI